MGKVTQETMHFTTQQVVYALGLDGAKEITVVTESGAITGIDVHYTAVTLSGSFATPVVISKALGEAFSMKSLKGDN
jgi:hypothetical protein